MERYNLIKEIGDGTFGTVWRAINKQTGEIVAVKKLKKKYYSWEECINLREVKSLRKLNHPNIVKLKEIIREYNILYFVFEYMECNVYELIKDKKAPVSEDTVRNWCFQVFQGLAYMHHRGYFHRDLKPENLLVSKETIKIADFGLAREMCALPPYTEYVSTRWYRAPEVLLQSYTYDCKVDIWAMGAIMAELFTLKPLFPGSSEADQIYRICSVIGSPTSDSWRGGLNLANHLNYEFPQLVGAQLRDLIPSASDSAIDIISSLCAWDPCKRPTAAEALQHSFFQACFHVPQPIQCRSNSFRTPPSAEKLGKLKHPNTRKSSEAVSNSKINNNAHHPKWHVSLSHNDQRASNVQRKLAMNNQADANGNWRLPSNITKHSNHQQPAKKNPSTISTMRNSPSVLKAAEKLAGMNISSQRHPVGNHRHQISHRERWKGTYYLPPRSTDIPGRV